MDIEHAPYADRITAAALVIAHAANPELGQKATVSPGMWQAIDAHKAALFGHMELCDELDLIEERGGKSTKKQQEAQKALLQEFDDARDRLVSQVPLFAGDMDAKARFLIAQDPGDINEVGINLDRHHVAGLLRSMVTDMQTLGNQLIAAIEAETKCYRDDDTYTDELGNEAIDVVNGIETKIQNAGVEDKQSPEYTVLLALMIRRVLIMNGDYCSHYSVDISQCQLVDAILKGTRFDNIAMLWQINGITYSERPTAAEFIAGGEAEIATRFANGITA